MRQLAEVDVLVVGGGPAGIGAGAAAARSGANTLLMERYGFLGGVAAHGMGMGINQMLPGGCSRGPVHDLVIERALSYGDEAARLDRHALLCNVEYLKAALMDVLDGAGCDYLLHTVVADTVVENGRVVGIVVATKAGLATVAADVTVDATGDGDVAHYAGAETMKGGEDGFLSPMTLCFIISGVDPAAALAFGRDGGCDRVVEQARERYPLLPPTVFFERPFPLRDSIVVNHGGTKELGPVDGTDAADMTKAESHSRRQALQIVAALKEFGGPPFKDAQLAAAASQVGVRETRRVKGLYVLTEDDAKSGRRFDDVVAWRSGYLDIGHVRWEPMQIHDVPYRSIIPEKMDGILAAGRCISATHVGASCGKSMGNCLATGHAAGLAAAMSAQRGVAPRQLDVTELQQVLIADGVPLLHRPEKNEP